LAPRARFFAPAWDRADDQGMHQRTLGRLAQDRRRHPRREQDARETLANQFVFDKDERLALKALERRRDVRRRSDVRGRLAALGG
jgi:hypothetical protein